MIDELAAPPWETQYGLVDDETECLLMDQEWEQSALEYHDVANIFPMMITEEYESLVQDIAVNGLIEPVWTYQGKIIDGRNRYKACRELKIRPTTREWNGQGSLISFVISLNLKRRHLTSGQKAVLALEVERYLSVEAKARQGKRTDLFSNNIVQIFAQCSDDDSGVWFKTAHCKHCNTTHGEWEEVQEFDNDGLPIWYCCLRCGVTTSSDLLDIVDDDSDNEPEPETTFVSHPKSRDAAAAIVGTNRQYVSDAKKIQAEAPDLLEKVRSGEVSISEAKQELKERNGEMPHVSHNSGNNEWYTPIEYIEAARSVLGEIDLDPASCEVANQVVKATRFFSKEDNGLEQIWTGKLWMNPPYAAELIGKFAEKMAAHTRSGDISEAIILVNNATETGWFRTLASVASAVIFPSSRVRFTTPSGIQGAPLQGQAVLYIGSHSATFLKAYQQFGWGAIIQ